MLTYEIDNLKNKNNIAGIDEAGRGPLAGPVVIACVIMPLNQSCLIAEINDSKKLTEKKRELLYEKIIERAIDYNIQIINEKIIDEINILNATKLGMKNCVNSLVVKPDIVLIDAVKIEVNVETKSIIHGDAISYNVAAASILAKVTRDRLMKELDVIYPSYNFKKHKGYGTREHVNNLIKNGPCVIHRKTFIKNFESQIKCSKDEGGL